MKTAFLYNSSLPGQHDHNLADDIFKCILKNKKIRIVIKISLKFVPKDPIDNKTLLV